MIRRSALPPLLAVALLAGCAAAAPRVREIYPGPGHTLDNVMVWVRSAGALFGGCAVRELATTSLGNTADGDLREWPLSIDRARARYGFAASVVVPGHGSPGGANLLEHTRGLFRP